MIRITWIFITIAISIIELVYVTTPSVAAQPEWFRRIAEPFLEYFDRRRRFGSRSDICYVAPGLLEPPVEREEEFEIWSDRPLFAWQETANDDGGEADSSEAIDKILVRDAETLEIFWDYSVPSISSSLIQYKIYSGKSLQPGRMYEWRIVRGEELSETQPSTEEMREILEWQRFLIKWESLFPRNNPHLFILQESANRILVRNADTHDTLWSYSVVTRTPQIVTYSGPTLQSDQRYEWGLERELESITLQDIQEEQFFTFRIMGASRRRDEITNRLGESSGGTPEILAVNRAEVFIEEQLWSDALQELYSTENENLENALRDIINSACNDAR